MKSTPPRKKPKKATKEPLRTRWRPVVRQMDCVTLVGGEVLYTHLPSLCKGQDCSIHHPSDHHMKTWRQHWREDRRMMERICPHGIGHPDPDELSFLRTRVPKDAVDAHAVHGCDGCCQVSK